MTPLAMFVGQRRCEIFGLILVTSAETCRRHGPVFSAATRLLQEKVVVLKGAEGGASCCIGHGLVVRRLSPGFRLEFAILIG